MGVLPTRLFPMGAASAPLPYDAEVDFVESTGEQYIDTGVAPSSSIRWTLRYMQITKTMAFYMGVNSGNRFRFVLESESTGYARAATSQQVSFVVADYNVQHTITLDGSGVAEFDGGRNTIAPANANPLAIYIIAANTSSGASIGTNRKFRVFWSKIWSSGVLVRDFVPVRVGTVGYLYDSANPTGGPLGNGLYGSATATPLVAGPDKAA